MDKKNIIISFLIFVLLLLFVLNTKEFFRTSCPEKNLIHIYLPTIKFKKKDGKELYNYFTETLAQNFVRVYNDVSKKKEKKSLGSFDKTNVYSNMQLYYKHMLDESNCDNIDLNDKNCETKSEQELIEFMNNDIQELEFILKNKKINDDEAKKRVAVIITTMINQNNYNENNINLVFIPCFYDFNEGNSIFKLETSEGNTYYVIELYKYKKQTNLYKKTIENIDYSQLPLNWYHTYNNNKTKIQNLTKKLNKKILDFEKEQETKGEEIKNIKLKIKTIEENPKFQEKKKLQEKIDKHYSLLKELNEKNYYKDPKVLRFQKFKRKKIPAELFPDVFLNSYKDAKDPNKINTKKEELIHSSLVVTYKNIVERQIKHLIDENKDKINNKMKEIEDKETKLKEETFEITVNGNRETKTYIQFIEDIKKYIKQSNSYGEEIIENDRLSCSDKSRITKIINILKKTNLKLRKYVYMVQTQTLLADESKLQTITISDMILAKTKDFKDYDNEKEIFYMEKKHDEIPITTPSITTNYLSSLKSNSQNPDNEGSYLDSFKDSFI